MNPRIRLDDDRHIRLETQADGSSYMHLTIQSDGRVVTVLEHGVITPQVLNWDDDGLAAACEAVQCKINTGLFAALSDESAVPYFGKLMRMEVRKVSAVIRITSVFADFVLYAGEGIQGMCFRSQLLPLAKKPVYRPYRPEEIAAHGYGFIRTTHNVLRLTAVLESGVSLSGGTLNLSYEQLLGCKWYDDKSVCGMLVNEDNAEDAAAYATSRREEGR